MRRTQTPAYRSSLLVMSGLALAGCQMPALMSPLVGAASPAPEQPAQSPAVASPQDVPLFGNHPATERAPHENRLLTNMTRHTFSSVGRDFDPDLHADGQTLAFASTCNSERPDIFLKHVDGFAITQLTSDPADDIQPRFSPDGEKIVFCSNRTGNWDIWLVNRDGTGLTQLTHDLTDEVAPCWSPDGKRVAFSACGRRSHQWEIWMLSVERPGVRRFLCYGMFPDWSPVGERITFQRARQRGTRWFSVWAIELVDDEARHPTELASSDSAACIAPRWSPDGKTIVYCAARQTAGVRDDPQAVPADVWVVDAETGTRLKITDGALDAFNPTWSSTGRIYFVSARSGVENIWSLGIGTDNDPSGRQAGTGPELLRAAVDTAAETGGK